MQLQPYIYFLVISLISGITVYFQKNSPLYLKALPIFLLLLALVEVIAEIFIRNGIGTSSLYNLFAIVNFCWYLFILKEIIDRPSAKKVIGYIIWIFTIAALVNLFFIQKMNNWNSITYSLGSLLIAGCSIFYFQELFRRPKAINLSREPAFWICSGLLFFYCCSFPLLGLANFITRASNVIRNNLGFLLSLLNILLYSLFTIAFLCRIKFRKHRKQAIG